MNNSIFDRDLLKHNLKRFSKNFSKSDFLFKEISHRLVEDIANFKQEFKDILEIGARDGYLMKEFAKIKDVVGLTQTNIVDNFGLSGQVFCDDEALNFPEKSFDLVINNLNLQFNNDVLAVLGQNRKILKEEGLYICSFFGGTTLKELRDIFYQVEMEISGGISPRIIPFIDVKTAGSLAQKAGFKNIICDSQIIEISYSSLIKLFQDLRNMGLSNILFDRNKGFISRKMLFLMEKLIKELYSDGDEGFIASFEVITITSFN